MIISLSDSLRGINWKTAYALVTIFSDKIISAGKRTSGIDFMGNNPELKLILM